MQTQRETRLREVHSQKPFTSSMTCAELVAKLHRLGARLSLENGRVHINAPKDSLGEELLRELSTRKNELRGWLESHLDECRSRPLLVRQSRPEFLPLSYAQQRLWFVDQVNGSSTEYNIPEALRLRGKLDLSALQRTISAIVERHEILRTHFGLVHGKPIQIVAPTLQIDVPMEDLSGLDQATQQQAVAAAMRKEWEQPFDLTCGPMLRLKLLKLATADHMLLRSFHHIVFDGWSGHVFNREFGMLYEAFLEGNGFPLEPLPVQYADFALWQRKWLEGVSMDNGVDYWKEELSGLPNRFTLPVDRPRPPQQTYRAASCSGSLPVERLAVLKQLSETNQATLFMSLLSAFAVLIHRYSGQDDVVVGSPIANRKDVQLEQLIGFFVNLLALRIRVKSGLSFRRLLSNVRETTLNAYRYQDVPFERLVQELSPKRRPNLPPFFQTVFVLHSTPQGLPYNLIGEVGLPNHYSL